MLHLNMSMLQVLLKATPALHILVWQGHATLVDVACSTQLVRLLQCNVGIPESLLISQMQALNPQQAKTLLGHMTTQGQLQMQATYDSAAAAAVPAIFGFKANHEVQVSESPSSSLIAVLLVATQMSSCIKCAPARVFSLYKPWYYCTPAYLQLSHAACSKGCSTCSAMQ